MYADRLEKSCMYRKRVIKIILLFIFVENERGSHKGQARKSARGMPWHWEPKKDVANCDKPRGAVNKRYIRGFPNGATHVDNIHVTCTE